VPKSFELLLTDTVDSLGIVGDVVKVKSGYARNYLLPRGLATEPTQERIAALAEKRREAERKLAEIRSQREQMIEKLEGVELTLERSCNDQGLLYGSITQKDIADALDGMGFTVRPRDVRLGQTIKRIDSYEISIKPESDLEATIKLWVVSDRPLEIHRHVEPVAAPAEPAAAEGEAVEGTAQEAEPKPARKPKGGKR